MNLDLAGGEAYFVLGSYLFPQKIGIGQFQPVLRYQDFDRDDGIRNHERIDAGFNYLIDGHNATIAVMYYRDKVSGLDSTNNVLVGVQLQI